MTAFTPCIYRSAFGLLAFATLTLPGSYLLGQGIEIPNYDTALKPFLEKHCISCHGPTKQKGKFRLDTLGGRVLNEDQAEDWQEVLDLINAGEMPPPDEAQPTREELTPVLATLYKTTAAARDAIARRTAGRMRRMNQREYVNTVEDRLGVRPKAELLPVDSGDFGFDTYGTDLTVTPAQLEGYLNTAHEVVQRMIWMNLPKAEAPEMVRYIFGDMSAYGGKPAVVLSDNRTIRRREMKKGMRDSLGVLPEPPDALAGPILKRFVQAAYRNQQVSPTILSDMNALFARGRKEGLDFWQSIADPMTTALASPNFVYVIHVNKTLTQQEVANRLALLLWGTPTPDKELLGLAENELLFDNKTYAQQMLRMLKDPKADRFFEAFVDQWLEMDRLDLVVIDQNLFPRVKKKESAIKTSMREEVRAFIKELVQNNKPARNLVDSDFTMLNPTLAEHYGIPYPDGAEGFQKVDLTGEHLVRGGILGKGAVQMLTSTGARTSPVERGAYILRRLLDRPPPPAPPDVPEVEENPDQEFSVRELLKHHSTTAQCATCHDRIDPIGFGMESFGAMGQWRTHEEQHPKSKRKPVPVDSSGRLPNGETFQSYDELKKLLVDQEERLARSFVKALMSYALGRPMGYTDSGEINAIIEKGRKQDFELMSLAFYVCTSHSFRNK